MELTIEQLIKGFEMQVLRENEWWTLPETANYLRVSRGTMYNMRNRGEGPRPRSIGGRVLYKVSEVKEWADKQAIPLPPKKPFEPFKFDFEVGDDANSQ